MMGVWKGTPMTITVQLPAHIERRLRAQAAERGVELAELVADTLSRSVAEEVSSQEPPASRTAQVEKALDKLAAYEPNWDGYGAPAIRRDVIAAARTFVRALPADLPRPPHVVPMSPGNLQFEWHDGPKVLELEFEDANTIHYLQWDPANGLEEEGTFPVTDVETAVGLIRWFTSGVVTA
jgi:hypothetical protein